VKDGTTILARPQKEKGEIKKAPRGRRERTRLIVRLKQGLEIGRNHNRWSIMKKRIVAERVVNQG